MHSSHEEGQSNLIELKVDYKKLNMFFADYLRNIIKGGTFIKTHRPFNIGTQFLFKLSISAIDKQIKIKGEVAWTRKPNEVSSPNEEAGMGIKFIFSNEEEQRQFHAFMEGLIKEKLGERNYRKLLEASSSG